MDVEGRNRDHSGVYVNETCTCHVHSASEERALSAGSVQRALAGTESVQRALAGTESVQTALAGTESVQTALEDAALGDTDGNMHETLRHCMLGVMALLRHLFLLMQELDTFTYFR